VGAGETFWLAPAQAPSGLATVRPSEPQAAPDETPSSPGTNCQTATAQARRAMRASQPLRALELLDEADESQAGRRCRDEIGYLRAEALRTAGRLREAIVAYRRLDRRGAEPAMRQNALFAAGELEERSGHHAAAYRRFEDALAVAPAGGLREEAMARAMQSAWAGRDQAQALSAAQRYLREYPAGTSAGRARAIVREAGGSEQR
jgi:tetratricopeptide (TPR) repeat protein